MLKIKNLTIRNFQSVGNVQQGISFAKPNITLVLGENLDLGGNDSRNGTGKCVTVNTIVTVRNPKTGEIRTTTIGKLFDEQEGTNN